MSIILIGYRGSGKTTVGRFLAAKLGFTFLDTDQIIIQRAGMTIREIFERFDEAHFRDLETQVMKGVIVHPDQVIALGGGAVLKDENRRHLRQAGHPIFYLRCEPAVLWDRISADPQTAANRPHLTHLGGGLQEITTLLSQREPIYREVMTAEVAGGRSPQEVAQEILKLTA